MPVHVAPDTFDLIVSEALDDVPPRLMGVLDNVVFLAEDEPPDDSPGLLGLYEGIPLTERGGVVPGMVPDRIFLFRGPLMRRCTSLDQLRREITVTVVHEIAHHFGIDDSRLQALGWG